MVPNGIPVFQPGTRIAYPGNIVPASQLSAFGKSLLSVFPLLLLAVAVISEVLRGSQDLRNQIIDAIVPAQRVAAGENEASGLGLIRQSGGR